jgi:hypothetical protein
MNRKRQATRKGKHSLSQIKKEGLIKDSLLMRKDRTSMLFMLESATCIRCPNEFRCIEERLFKKCEELIEWVL